MLTKAGFGGVSAHCSSPLLLPATGKSCSCLQHLQNFFSSLLSPAQSQDVAGSKADPQQFGRWGEPGAPCPLLLPAWATLENHRLHKQRKPQLLTAWSEIKQIPGLWEHPWLLQVVAPTAKPLIPQWPCRAEPQGTIPAPLLQEGPVSPPQVSGVWASLLEGLSSSVSLGGPAWWWGMDTRTWGCQGTGMQGHRAWRYKGIWHGHRTR